MRKGRVAVQSNLTDFKDYLDKAGYEVVQMDPVSVSGVELQNCRAIVINGMDRNLLGMQDIHTKSPVIDATGKTPEQVYQQLQNYFVEK